MGKKLSAALLSVLVNIILLIVKSITAVITGSLALYAECAHSFFDLVASIFAVLGIKKAEEPEDQTHNFGHEKFENLSSFLQSMLILITAFVILYESFERFSSPSIVVSSEIGIGLMVVSIPIIFFVSKYLSDIAKEEGSAALEADSLHFITDAAGSIAVLIGLIFVKLGFPIGDPIAAAIVGLIMLYASSKLILDSFKVFLDASPDKEIMDKISSVLDLEQKSKQITRYHKLRARIAGSRLFVEVHIHLPHNTNVELAHTISHEIESKIIKKVPQVKEVTVHIEPD